MTQRIWNRLTARPALRQVGGLMLGTLTGQLILMISAPILTRLYTPTDYGILASYSALVLILSVLVTMRYDLAVLLPNRDDEAEQLTRMALGVTVILSIGTGMALWTAAHWLNLPFLQPLKPYFGLLTLSVLLHGASQVLTYRLIRLQQFAPQMHSRWLQAVGYALAQLIGGVLRVGAVGLLTGQVVGQLATVLVLGKGIHFQQLSPTRVRTLMKQYRELPLYSMPAALLSTLGTQAPLLLTASFYSLQETGWLMLGLRLIAAPIDLIGTSVGQVYLGRAADYRRRSPEALHAFVWRVIRLLFGFALLPAILLMLFAPNLFAWVFGAKWRASGEYLQILTPLLLMRLVATPISQTLVITRRLGFQLGWETLRLVLVILSFWLPAAWGQPFHVALIGYAGVYTLSLLMLISLILWSVRQPDGKEQDLPVQGRIDHHVPSNPG